MNVIITKGVDAIDGVYTNFTTASGTVTNPNIIFSTSTASTTAYITGITVGETRAGDPAYVAEPPNFFFVAIDTNTYPTSVSRALSASSIALSAIGRDGAIGDQVLTYTVSLSTSCLTQAGSAAPTTQSVDLSARTQTFTTTVNALNTPFGNRTSKAEHLRLWNLNS